MHPQGPIPGVGEVHTAGGRASRHSVWSGRGDGGGEAEPWLLRPVVLCAASRQERGGGRRDASLVASLLTSMDISLDMSLDVLDISLVTSLDMSLDVSLAASPDASLVMSLVASPPVPGAL